MCDICVNTAREIHGAGWSNLLTKKKNADWQTDRCMSLSIRFSTPVQDLLNWTGVSVG